MVEYEPTQDEIRAAQAADRAAYMSERSRYNDLPPRNPQEYANKILQAHYSESFPLLTLDLILANLSVEERENAWSYLRAATALAHLEAAYATQGHKTNWTIASDYEQDFCFLVDSSRAIDGRTLDAATVQRVAQETKHKEELHQGKKGVLRRFF